MQPNQQPDLQRPDQNQVASPPVPPRYRSPQSDRVIEPLSPAMPNTTDFPTQSAPEEQPMPSAVPAPQPQSEESEVNTPVQSFDQPAAEDDTPEESEEGNIEPVSWTAHEYIHQEKGTKWLVIFALITTGFVALSVWMQAWSFTALIAVIAFIVVVYLRRPPRELDYSLTEEGLTIDNKLYKYDDFKSFGVIRDGEDFSVMLIPTQRFQPSVTVYFPEEVGEDIVDVLGEILPMKDLKLDAVDRLVRMLRL